MAQADVANGMTFETCVEVDAALGDEPVGTDWAAPVVQTLPLTSGPSTTDDQRRSSTFA